MNRIEFLKSLAALSVLLSYQKKKHLKTVGFEEVPIGTEFYPIYNFPSSHDPMSKKITVIENRDVKVRLKRVGSQYYQCISDNNNPFRFHEVGQYYTVPRFNWQVCVYE